MSRDCDESLPLTGTVAEIKKWAKQNRMPFHVNCELTPFCNFNCPMCYVHLTPEMAAGRGHIMSATQWLEIARQFADMGAFSVNLTGGEPLLHPGFWDIYEGMIKLGLRVSVFTNGYLIDEKVAERFKAYPPHGIKISLYGAGDETYERVCGVKRGFTKVTHAVECLKQAGIPYLVTGMLINQNLSDRVAMRKYAYENRIAYADVSGVSGTARDSLGDPRKSRIALADRVPPDLTPEQAAGLRHRAAHTPYEACRNFGITCVVTWHGHMQCCSYTEHEYVQLSEPLDVPAAWKAMLEQADSLTLPPECATCRDAEFCEYCPGTMAGESGDPRKVCEAFCERAAYVHKLYDTVMSRRASGDGSDAQ